MQTRILEVAPNFVQDMSCGCNLRRIIIEPMIQTFSTAPFRASPSKSRIYGSSMQIRDGLYGEFVVPDYLVELVLTPEVYRLSQIRLINTPSPSFPALADVRRFSHTLGVLHLCQLARRAEYSADEWSAFEMSVLLHDVGTAPFGHLFEYHLAEHGLDGWNHEAMIAAVLASVHAPENTAHQIYAKRTVRLRKQAHESGIDLNLVEAIISKVHPLSKLLFGTIDLDNLDNVARMGWAIGIRNTAETAEKLAQCLSVSRSGDLLLEEVAGRKMIREWLRIRRVVYEVLLYDLVAVSLQAVLSEAIGRLVRGNSLEASDWTLTDEQLLDRLLADPETKTAMINEYFGIPPLPVFCIRINGTLEDLGLKDRAAGKQLVESLLSKHFSMRACIGYVIVDKGTFEKRLEFVDPMTRLKWDEGVSTGSVLFYGFVRGRRSVGRQSCARVASDFLTRIAGTWSESAEVHLGVSTAHDYDQRTLSFKVEEHRLGLL